MAAKGGHVSEGIQTWLQSGRTILRIALLAASKRNAVWFGHFCGTLPHNRLWSTLDSDRMDTIEKLIQRAEKTQHGFLDIRKAADEVVAGNAAQDSLRFARQLFT